MPTIVGLHHLTEYRYDRPIRLGMQTIRLRPAPHTRSHIQSYALKVLPKGHFINWQQDPFGNFLALLVFPEPTDHFRVEVDLVSEIRVFNPFDFFLEKAAEHYPFTYDADLKEELAPYLEIKEQGKLLKEWVDGVDTKKTGTVDFLVALNQQLYSELSYLIRLEPGIQSCEETLTKKSGSCRDMAWLLCQILRHLGLATRFASGYLIQLKADVASLDGPSGTDVDFTDLHAWTEVYLPGAGWVGLDPTSGLFAGEGHIPLCCTPNPSSAAPISGLLDPCESTLNHKMAVTRLHEDRRVTRPYTDNDWQQIDTLGTKVDKELKKHDVRLTMGGEPTFVSLDDVESDCWHFAALGANKKLLGETMLRRMQSRFAPGSLLQYVQGKWYPGEILPRWAMNCHWRGDKQPVWKNQSLLADPEITPSKRQAAALKQAEQLIAAIATGLGIPSNYAIPAYEDASDVLLKELRLPVEGSAAKGDEYAEAERIRIRKFLQSNLAEPTGFVLPLAFSASRNRWISNRWQFKEERLLLLPGDSPVGLRLPLASLPWHPTGASETLPHRDPFTPPGDLPSLPTHAALLKQAANAKASDKPFAKDPNGLIHTALCVEARNGILHIFLPPISYLEHFLELIAAIEHATKTLSLPVVLEGYGPPGDRRLQHFSVTPDPGVLEINVHPATDWKQLKHITETVYEEARQARLSTDKFMLDGRRVGTGGGNHIVLGAATPKDSPFLRRPDLLRSMLTFWQHHPALSYLFSGLYIGPTSQSPRIDEARHDSLYELEIAQSQVERGKDVPPWLVDRLYRNLLVDLTGNTHRAEFCIDKLYSPDSSRGRLGLLEMRAFEMTPHPQMNLLQALLIRALIAHFWQHPYTGRFTRWGTQLHDRFMLPEFVWQDLQSVLAFLRHAGYAFQDDWFLPFLDFRFPLYGKTQVGPLTLELRLALEPWPVMGEEASAGGTSRAVDSSVERLQVKVSNHIDERYLLTCNRRPLPLQPTETPGVFVAGVRFKAWAPYSSLHPNLPVNSPLIFDVLDRYHERSLGGCTYHVMHPGGRAYEDVPINENAAEGRRLSRFQTIGHTPGNCEIPPPQPNPDFPCTLDLRRSPV